MAMVVTGVVPAVMVLPMVMGPSREVEMRSRSRGVGGAGVRVPSRDSTEDHRHDHKQHGQRSHWHTWHEGPSNCSPRAMLPPNRGSVVSVRIGHRHPPPGFSERSSIARPGRWLRDSLQGVLWDVDTPENSASENSRRSPLGRSLPKSQLFQALARPLGIGLTSGRRNSCLAAE